MNGTQAEQAWRTDSTHPILVPSQTTSTLHAGIQHTETNIICKYWLCSITIVSSHGAPPRQGTICVAWNLLNLHILILGLRQALPGVLRWHHKRNFVPVQHMQLSNLQTCRKHAKAASCMQYQNHAILVGLLGTFYEQDETKLNDVLQLLQGISALQ